jgi:Bor protein
VKARVVLVAALCLVSSGCFRTIYRNLQPPDAPPVVETAESLAHRSRSGWLSFYLWGIVPSGITVDAAAACGGGEHVATIETEMTGLEFTIALVEGYLFVFDIYSPYNGHVTCDHATDGRGPGP